jgi:hypothetical protein
MFAVKQGKPTTGQIQSLARGCTIRFGNTGVRDQGCVSTLWRATIAAPAAVLNPVGLTFNSSMTEERGVFNFRIYYLVQLFRSPYQIAK